MTEKQYATIKLISGQEVLGSLLSNKEGTLIIENPILIHRSMTPIGIQVTCTPWLMFSDNQTISLEKDKIVAFNVGLDDNSKDQYEAFVKEVIHGDLKLAKREVRGAEIGPDDLPLGFDPDDPALKELEDSIKAYFEQRSANTVLH